MKKTRIEIRLDNEEEKNEYLKIAKKEGYKTFSEFFRARMKKDFSKIYPNPTKNEINISLLAQPHPTDIIIYDALLREIFSQSIPSNTTNFSISTNNLKSGYYIVKFNSLEKSWTNKLIISE